MRLIGFQICDGAGGSSATVTGQWARYGGAWRTVCASRNRRRLSAAALAVLSMFSCSYGDREDKEEDAKAKRAEAVLPPRGLRPPADRHVTGGETVKVTRTLS